MIVGKLNLYDIDITYRANIQDFQEDWEPGLKVKAYCEHFGQDYFPGDLGFIYPVFK